MKKEIPIKRWDPGPNVLLPLVNSTVISKECAAFGKLLSSTAARSIDLNSTCISHREMFLNSGIQKDMLSLRYA